MNDLSPAELRVMQKLFEGYTQKEVAQWLCRDPATVDKHAQAILRKLDARNMVHAAVIYCDMAAAERERQIKDEMARDLQRPLNRACERIIAEVLGSRPGEARRGYMSDPKLVPVKKDDK